MVLKCLYESKAEFLICGDIRTDHLIENNQQKQATKNKQQKQATKTSNPVINNVQSVTQ
jgi:predicted nucleic acid-binding protein